MTHVSEMKREKTMPVTKIFLSLLFYVNMVNDLNWWYPTCIWY